jgi:hypothetical protein
MKSKKGTTFTLISGGMEVCWLYGWAAFSMTAIMGKPFTFVGAIVAFALALILTNLSLGKGWRIIQIGSLQIPGIACAAMVTAYTTYYPSYPFAATGWFFAFFHQSRTPLEWTVLALVFIWTVLFWIGGCALARRPRAYFTVCARFDVGLAAFFCLFLAKLVLLDRGGIQVNDPISSSLVFPFFLFSLLAIGIARIERKVPKDYLPGYRGIGIITTFIAIVLLSAGAAILFFLPFMTAVADTGYRVLRGGAGFVLPVVERVLRFIFTGRNIREEPADSSPKSDGWNLSPSMDGTWMQVFENVLRWGVKGLALLLVVAAFGFIAFYLIKWLLSKTKYVRKDTAEVLQTMPWFRRLWTALVLFYRRLLLSIRGYKKASELYAVLLRWGQHSGIARFIHETPLEFGARLDKHFPPLKTQINLIVSAFNRETYGEVNLSGEGMKQAQSAWRALRNPRHWPLRIKIRLFDPGNVKRF